MKVFSPILISLFFVLRISAQTCDLNCNGSFDNTSITTGVVLVGTIPCWSTTASNGTMEVWGNGFNGVPSFNGAQFVELNATMAATMYQTFTVTAGTPLTIGFAHRGRAGIDTVQVSIGPVGGPYVSLGKWGDGTSAWGYHTPTYTPTASGAFEIRFTPVYWTGGNVAIGNFLDAVSVSSTLNLSVTATPTAVCAGSSVTLTAMGANSYTWSNFATTSTLVVTPMVNTTYSVIASASACLGSASITINVNSGLALSIAGPTSVCLGSSLTLTAGGASTYVWNNGATSSSIVATPTANTTYSVIGAVGSCTGSLMHTVSVTPIPIVSIPQQTYNVCIGSGTLLNVSGATSYTLLPGGFTAPPFMVFPNANTQYTVVGSVAGCVSNATTSINLMPLPVPILTSNSPLCNGANLTLSANGGVSYLWSGPSSFTSALQNPIIASVTPAQAGVYNLTVTAANGCMASANVSVSVIPPPPLSISGGTICAGQTLTLSATSSVGSTFLWSGPLNFTSTSQNISFINPTAQQAGVYTVVVSAVSGCTNTATVSTSVLSLPNPQISLTKTVICAQAHNGSSNTLNASFSGGITYTLTPPAYINNSNPYGSASQLSMNAPYLPTGAVTLTLTASNGYCSATSFVTFTVIPNPVVVMTTPTPICVGQSFSFTASGAGAYQWSTSSQGSISSITGNMAVVSPTITQVVSVIGSSLGCNSATDSKTLVVNPFPEFVINPDPAIACIGSSLVLAVKGNGSEYKWMPATGLSSTVGSTVSMTPPLLQNYQYTVIASINTCTNSATVTVSVMPLPVAVIAASTKTWCVNDTLTLLAGGGESYNWHGPTGFVGDKQLLKLKVYSMTYAGTYTLTVTDSNNCRAATTKSVALYNLPGGYFPEEQLKGCVPFCSNFSFQTPAMQASLNMVSWQINNEHFKENKFKYCFTKPGAHHVKGMLRDTNGCANVITVTVNVLPKPKADFSFLPEMPVETLDPVIFTNTSKGEQIKSWDWYFTDNNGHRSQNENTTFTYEDAGFYPVALVATNVWGCKDTVVKVVPVEKDFSIYVPNIFTPNEDGKNEVFLPVIRGATSYQLMIFDRWGERVFETSDLAKGWDGTFKGKPCKNDVYVWKISLFVNKKGDEKVFNGHVKINR